MSEFTIEGITIKDVTTLIVDSPETISLINKQLGALSGYTFNITECSLDFEEKIDESTFLTFVTGAHCLFPNLKRFTVSPNNRFYQDVDGVLYSKDGKILWCCPMSYRALNNEFYIPEGTEIVSKNAFAENGRIEKLHLANSLKFLLSGAFFAMHKLEFVDFGDGLKKIGDENAKCIFSECKKLESVYIPDSIETIGSYAFYKCVSLKNVIFHEGLKHIGRHAFDATKVKAISLPSTVETIGEYAFYPTMDITITRTNSYPLGIIDSAVISNENEIAHPMEYQFSVLKIHDVKNGNTFCFPKLLQIPTQYCNLSLFFNTGMAFKTDLDLVSLSGFRYTSPLMKYISLIELYKNNLNNRSVYNKIKESSNKLIRTFLIYEPTSDNIQLWREKLIEFLDFGIAGYEDILSVYQYAIEENDMVLAAYAMDAINKIFPEHAAEVFKKLNI